MKAIVLAGTRGIGKSIVDNIHDICDDVVSPGKSESDTSDPANVLSFAKKHPSTDILVLNTGGPLQCNLAILLKKFG